MANVIVLSIVAIAFILALRKTIKNVRNGGTCSCCSKNASCTSCCSTSVNELNALADRHAIERKEDGADI